MPPAIVTVYRHTALVLLVAAIFMLSGCVRPPMIETPAGFETIDQGAYGDGPKEAQEQVISDPDAWASFWQEHRARQQAGFGAPGDDDNESTPPEVDFDTAFVLVLHAGEKRTGGHTIAVTNVTLRGDVYDVDAVEQEPGEGCMTTQSLTYPYDIVQVERGEDDDAADPQVTVDRTTNTYSCPRS